METAGSNGVPSHAAHPSAAQQEPWRSLFETEDQDHNDIDMPSLNPSGEKRKTAQPQVPLTPNPEQAARPCPAAQQEPKRQRIDNFMEDFTRSMNNNNADMKEMLRAVGQTAMAATRAVEMMASLVGLQHAAGAAHGGPQAPTIIYNGGVPGQAEAALMQAGAPMGPAPMTPPAFGQPGPIQHPANPTPQMGNPPHDDISITLPTTPFGMEGLPQKCKQTSWESCIHL